MTKNEFISKLESYLGNMQPAEKGEILYDYQEHFSIGLASGRTEDQICAELGDPRTIAKQYRIESIVKNAEDNKSAANILKAVFAALTLGFFNLVFILPVFCALLGVLIGLYGAALGITLGGVGVFLGTLMKSVFPDLISIPDVNPGVLIFGSIALTSLGTLFCIADAYVTKFFYMVTLKYVKANISIITRR